MLPRVKTLMAIRIYFEFDRGNFVSVGFYNVWITMKINEEVLFDSDVFFFEID